MDDLNALFLKLGDEDYSIPTGYELGGEGVLPLDNSRQFEIHHGKNEAEFLNALRDAVVSTFERW